MHLLVPHFFCMFISLLRANPGIINCTSWVRFSRDSMIPISHESHATEVSRDADYFSFVITPTRILKFLLALKTWSEYVVKTSIYRNSNFRSIIHSHCWKLEKQNKVSWEVNQCFAKLDLLLLMAPSFSYLLDRWPSNIMAWQHARALIRPQWALLIWCVKI